MVGRRLFADCCLLKHYFGISADITGYKSDTICDMPSFAFIYSTYVIHVLYCFLFQFYCYYQDCHGVRGIWLLLFLTLKLRFIAADGGIANDKDKQPCPWQFWRVFSHL
jgi:hypothetical protein